jgi:tRNA-splicing ligase RtcB
MIEIKTDRLTIKCWATDLEEEARKQAIHMALHPYTQEHTALMPDCHMGYGVPIGSVSATKNVILPSNVGLDIGCGCMSIQTDIRMEDMDKNLLTTIMEEIREVVPSGLGIHNKLPNAEAMPSAHGLTLPIVDSEWESAMHQIGTLGSGNHFCELERDDFDKVHVTIHSGSRNLGKKVAEHYIEEANQYTLESDVYIPPKWELPILPANHDYLKEMNYCLEFAKASRNLMMQNVISVPSKHFNYEVISALDIHHNYANLEEYNGKTYWIHRKGATSAKLEELGIIPGSQGTSTYIVEGRGNVSSFQSCSHGAGRKMGREAAKRTLNLETEQASMEGILHSVRNKDSLDEAPGAYKDVQVVLDNQLDLIKPLMTLYPIACIKGENGNKRRRSRNP